MLKSGVNPALSRNGIGDFLSSPIAPLGFKPVSFSSMKGEARMKIVVFKTIRRSFFFSLHLNKTLSLDGGDKYEFYSSLCLCAI